MKRALLIFTLLALGICRADASTLEPYAVWGTIAVGADGLVRVAWDMNYGNTQGIDGYINLVTYNTAGTIVASGPGYGPYAGWAVPRIAAGPNNTFYLGWFDPSTIEVGQWLMNSSDALQSASAFQSQGVPTSTAGGPPNYYGYVVDQNGDGMFGVDWEDAVSPGLIDGWIASTNPNSSVGFDSYDRGSVALAYLPSTNYMVPNGNPVNLSQTTTGGTLLWPIPAQPLVQVGAIGGWQPTEATTTPNGHTQIWWQYANAGTYYFSIWDIDQNGNISDPPATYMGAWHLVSAAGNPFGGNGQLVGLWTDVPAGVLPSQGTGEDWGMGFVSPANGQLNWVPASPGFGAPVSL